MGKRVIYVGGMAEIISDRCLRELFSMYGLVSDAYIVRQKQSSKSAGYGFVEMASGEQALRPVVALEGAELEGSCLRLSVTPYVSRSQSSLRRGRQDRV